MILNIGAGFLPLTSSDFANDLDIRRIVNFDILATDDTALKIKFLQLIYPFQNASGGLEYFTARDQLDRAVDDRSVDLILGVSPFGFSLVDEWSDSKLCDNGYVVVLGNRKNKFTDRELFHPDLMTIYLERTPQPGFWVFAVSERVRLNYPSNTTGLEKDTQLDYRAFWQKGRRTGVAQH